ncbi:hypothetical protein M405DRAFT_897606 [Rhizopogon salebrosus TDB-379]|nr:hypothetical protein M405DRAFT_897606 [Rhizopogon salebrosus TDB-379]
MQGFANARSDIIASTLIDKQDMPRPRLIQRSRGCCVKIVVPLVEETLSSGHVWLHPLHVEVTTQECRQRRLYSVALAQMQELFQPILDREHHALITQLKQDRAPIKYIDPLRDWTAPGTSQYDGLEEMVDAPRARGTKDQV